VVVAQNGREALERLAAEDFDVVLTGPATGSGRVSRGGNWIDGARYCRSAYRDGDAPDYRYGHLGFRLAFSSVDQSGQ
jgi:formylglycine-generating enzyme required for sulfatase activity